MMLSAYIHAYNASYTCMRTVTPSSMRIISASSHRKTGSSVTANIICIHDRKNLEEFNFYINTIEIEIEIQPKR